MELAHKQFWVQEQKSRDEKRKRQDKKFDSRRGEGS
jgi:hypothetical protein